MKTPLKIGSILMAAAVVFSADPQEPIHAGPVYTSLTVFPEVKVLVAVPPTARPEMLKPGSFTLRVDSGGPTPGTVVQTLAETGLGMAAVVLLDVSGSMAGGPLNAIRGGLVKFTSEATLGDRLAICTVADDTRWDMNWNDTPDQMKAALAGLKPRGSLTRLWDGLVEIAGKYPETPLARRVVVISDGHDEGSKHTLDEVIAAAALQHVVVDSIGMTRSDPKFLANLARLSSVTGGVYRPAASLTILEQLVGGGIKRYRTLPVVTFRPEGITADGKSHSFLVTWNGGGAELQSPVESLVPDDLKQAIPTPGTPSSTKAAEPAAKVETPAEGTTPGQKGGIPKAWLYAGAGGLAAVLLVVVLVVLLVRKKKPAAPAPPAIQQTPMVHPPTPSTPPVAFNKGLFGQSVSPTPAVAPPPPPPKPFAPGSVFMALPPEPEPLKPVRPRDWFPVPAKGRPSAWLVGIEGPEQGKSFPVDDVQFWIGANPNNHLVLADDPTVSGNHACIAFENDTLGLFDHRSTNGLFLNDQRVTEERRVMLAGDRLRVGRSTFVLRPHDAA